MLTLSVPAVRRPVKKPVQKVAAARSPTRTPTRRIANDSDDEGDGIADDEDDGIAARLKDLDSATEVSDLVPVLRELMERLDGKTEQ